MGFANRSTERRNVIKSKHVAITRLPDGADQPRQVKFILLVKLNVTLHGNVFLSLLCCHRHTLMSLHLLCARKFSIASAQCLGYDLGCMRTTYNFLKTVEKIHRFHTKTAQGGTSDIYKKQTGNKSLPPAI